MSQVYEVVVYNDVIGPRGKMGSAVAIRYDGGSNDLSNDLNDDASNDLMYAWTLSDTKAREIATWYAKLHGATVVIVPRAINDERAQEYLREYGHMCPYCRSISLHGDHVDVETMSRSVICNDCGRQWYEGFAMTSIIADGTEYVRKES